MKKAIFAVIMSVMVGMVLMPASVHAWANGEAPWGAPVMPGGTVLTTEGTTTTIEYNLPFDKVAAWYTESMKTYPDEKFRDWKDQLYIEDQGGANWHSIGISKMGGDKTTVKIVRDNMTWVMSTLLIRFAGVFLVLCILWVFLNINSFCMKKFFPEKGKAKA